MDQCVRAVRTAENGTIMSYCHLCPGGLSNIALLPPASSKRASSPLARNPAPRPLCCSRSHWEECGAGSSRCIADINGDGILTPTDFTARVVAYNAGDLAADCNPQRRPRTADFSAWVASGSPAATSNRFQTNPDFPIGASRVTRLTLMLG